MTRENFWSGFAAGAAFGALAGVGAVLAFKRGSGDVEDHVIRLEKSINIGCPVETVFAAWSNFERLPQYIDFVRRVERNGNHTRWLVNIDGREFAWDAEIAQVVPNESIGWKSVTGPKHSGRISFAPLGDQTVVHVLMNYVPPLGPLASLLPIEEHLEHWIDRGLREFKSSMERQTPQEPRPPQTVSQATQREPLSRTGTTDAGDFSTGPVGTPGKPAAPGTVGYTRTPHK